MARTGVIFNIDWNGCIRCGACVAVCPHPEPFTTPFDTIAVNRACVVACMLCERVCPLTAITSHSATNRPVAVRA
ncbi:MAG: 4Fe-4S binding protein [Ardenticatenaceae bacterium]|nr:4Fe-4S binding protein [Ardenticatenaceae bacterium]HBY97596.1 hypothetical protein [Chloroflexota bacterium]